LFAQPFADDIHLRFMFSEQSLARVVLPYIIDRAAKYGRNTTDSLKDTQDPESERKTVIVEFSSPNIGKEFDGFHLRSTITGSFVAGLYESFGWNVHRMNFLGDWGKHIGTLAVGWERFGSEDTFASDPLRHLLDVFTKITAQSKAEQDELKKVEGQEKGAKVDKGQIDADKDAFFKKMEDGDVHALALWKRFRETCITDYQRLYSRMGINFDDYSGESTVSHESITEVENVLKEKGVSEDSKGAWVIDFAKHQHAGLGTSILRFQEGTTSYLLRDIAAVLQRYQQHTFDRMIYVVSAKQVSHFRQVIAALELMGRNDLAGKLEHVSFEKSKGLKPRSETPGLLLRDILDDAQAAVSTYMEGFADQGQISPEADTQGQAAPAEAPTEATEPSVANGAATASITIPTAEPGALALSVQVLSARRGTTYAYEPSKLASKEAYSASYLQTCLDVLESELDDSEFRPVGSQDNSDKILAFLSNPATDYSLFIEEAYVTILRHLVHFPGAVTTAQKTLESSGLLTYLYALADCVYGMLEVEREANAEEDESNDQDITVNGSMSPEPVPSGDKQRLEKTTTEAPNVEAAASGATTVTGPTKGSAPETTELASDDKEIPTSGELLEDADKEETAGSTALPYRRHDSVLDITDNGPSGSQNKPAVNAVDDPTPQVEQAKTDPSTRPALRSVFIIAVRYVLVSGFEILGLDFAKGGTPEAGASAVA
jgi:arginyl-tRNA synthetase